MAAASSSSGKKPGPSQTFMDKFILRFKDKEMKENGGKTILNDGNSENEDDDDIIHCMDL